MHEADLAGHDRYMRRCFELARRGLGYTRSNPIVGAVLVHNDRIIGEGWHRQWGGAHAEVACLDSVLPEDRTLVAESTLYVSLEPCAHWGKQPPCAERIVQEGIRRVVVSVDDPAPHVSGRGYQILDRAGIAVTRGVLREEGRWLARRFLSLHEQRRPYIILKWAQSADGLMAPPGGRRVMMSGPVSQRLVHRWRTEEDSILVGYRTAALDNPKLTARLWEGRQPLRVVLDRDGALPSTQHVYDAEAETWIVSEKFQAGEGDRMRFLHAPFDEKLLPTLLRELVAANISSLLVEGGAATLDQFIRAGLWDEARVFYTPVLLGDGLPAPTLHDAGGVVQNSEDGKDSLSVFTRASSPYSYRVDVML